MPAASGGACLYLTSKDVFLYGLPWLTIIETDIGMDTSQDFTTPLHLRPPAPEMEEALLLTFAWDATPWHETPPWDRLTNLLNSAPDVGIDWVIQRWPANHIIRRDGGRRF